MQENRAAPGHQSPVLIERGQSDAHPSRATAGNRLLKHPVIALHVYIQISRGKLRGWMKKSVKYFWERGA
jgi:hypothetical protein